MILQALVNVILPVVIVAGVGFALARAFDLDPDTLGKVNLYGLTAPLVFSSLLTTKVSGGAGLLLVAAYFLVSLIGGLMAWLAGRGQPGSTRKVGVACVLLGNNGNFGLPIALLALGQEGFDQSVIYLMCAVVLIYTVGPLLLGASTSVKAALRDIVKLPVTWALVLAPFIRVSGVTVPTGIMRGIEMLSVAAVPMVLVGLGVQLSQSGRIRLTAPVVVPSVLRVAVLPLVAWGVAWFLRLPPTAMSSLVLCFAMPTAVNVFMLAREYGTDPATSASVVALTTTASIGTIALVISLLPAAG